MSVLGWPTVQSRRDRVLGSVAMPSAVSDTTIDAVLPQVLAEQRQRLSTRTYRRYEEVVELLRDCLDGYACQSLDDNERRRSSRATTTVPSAVCSFRRRSPRTLANFSTTSWCARWSPASSCWRPWHGHRQVGALARWARLLL